MPVEYTVRGRNKTAKDEFFIFQYPSGGSTADLPDELRSRLRRTGQAQEVVDQAENGDWILVADGSIEILGPSAFPTEIHGRTGPGAFGFGGLDANIEVLNEYYKADRSFAVKRGAGEWVTVVDGEDVFVDSEFHPFYISWQAEADRAGLL